MAQLKLDITLDEIKNLIFQLPAHDLLALVEAIEDRAETVAMMKLAESGFREWNGPGEDVYDAET